MLLEMFALTGTRSDKHYQPENGLISYHSIDNSKQGNFFTKQANNQLLSNLCAAKLVNLCGVRFA